MTFKLWSLSLLAVFMGCTGHNAATRTNAGHKKNLAVRDAGTLDGRTFATPIEDASIRTDAAKDQADEPAAGLLTSEDDSGLARDAVGQGQPTLLMTTVDFAVHCCTAPPTQANLMSTVLTADVTDGIEFPSIQNNGPSVIAADVDVSQSAIDIVYTTEISATSGDFNGYEFDFHGPEFSKITNAVLGPATTAPTDLIVVTFDDDSIFVNVANLQTEAGMRISVLLTLE
jgi:hypothetical protein